MPSKKDNEYQHAGIILDKMIKISGLSQTQFADRVLGIKGGNISGARKTGKIPDGWFDIVQEKYSVSKEELCELEPSLDKQQLSVAEPTGEMEYQEGKMQKYEKLLWKFEHVFDFLIEFHEEDSIAIRSFLNRLEKDFLMQDPDYRMWLYEKKAEADERLKKRSGEDHQDKLPETKSINGK